jgi:hypothetical protein
MTVALPTGGVATATPRFLDRGGVLKAIAGGSDQRLDRIGDKMGASFTTKPMKGEEARIWSSRLIRGRKEKASIKFPQPGVSIAQSVDYTVDGAQGAQVSTLLVKTASAGEIGKTFKEGQFITVIHLGIRYVHQVTADTVVSGLQKATLPIQPPTRFAPADNDVVEVISPKIEGYVSADSALEWSADQAKVYQFQFDIEEAK